jgi:UDP-GlcNAc:undecaprenyl-phosphate GlcNAc-1-phosphate transferase
LETGILTEGGSTYLGVAAVTFAVSVVATWTVRGFARNFSILSVPRGDRWRQRAVPLLGGIAIAVSFLISFLLFVPKEHEFVLIVIGGLGLFLIGLLDDFVKLKPYQKLVGQVCIATALVFWGVVLPFSNSEFTNSLITLIWIVAITNAVNLLDNIDGLCAGIALIAGFYRLLFCALNDHTGGVLFALVFMAAVAGFLLFNFSPASIFMGDAGSLFIGFVLAGMNISPNHAHVKGVFSVLLFPVLVMLIPIFDSALVTVTRSFSGRRASEGGSDHTSHRLVAIGLSERRAVLVLYVIAALSGAIAYLLYLRGFSYTLFFISLFIVALVLFAVYLNKVKIYESVAAFEANSTKKLLTLLANSRYFNQMTGVVLDVFLVFTAYYAAYWLRFDLGDAGNPQLERLTVSFPLLLVCSLISFAIFGVYRQDWRYTGLADLVNMLKASAVGVVATVLLLTYLFRFEGYSRSVFLIYWGAVLILLAGSRLSTRLIDRVLGVRPAASRRVLVYGANDEGELVLYALQHQFQQEVTVVGLLDQDPERLGTSIRGVRVLGGSEDAERLVRELNVEEVIVSSSAVSSEQLNQLKAASNALGIKLITGSLRFEEIT